MKKKFLLPIVCIVVLVISISVSAVTSEPDSIDARLAPYQDIIDELNQEFGCQVYIPSDQKEEVYNNLKEMSPSDFESQLCGQLSRALSTEEDTSTTAPGTTSKEIIPPTTSVNPPPASETWYGPITDPGIGPFDSSAYWYRSDTIWNGRSGNTFEFRLDEDFQYAKIWILNESGGPITLTTEWEGGEFGDAYTYADGESGLVWVCGKGNVGEFRVNLNADNGDILDGQITICTGTQNGVGYTGDM